MKIFVINAGSSSLKYRLIDMNTESVIAKGNCECIGSFNGLMSYHNFEKKSVEKKIQMDNHADALHEVIKNLLSKEVGVISELSEITAIGHRIVQGGDIFKESTIVNQTVIDQIESLIPLAPLHNGAHVQAIKACLEVFGKTVPQVVVFDTSFHSSIPPKAFIYPIPYKYYEKYAVRKYGFHGTSHRYVSKRCSEILNQDITSLKIITCHLGNGSSIAAIKNGKVIDTSMGLTPLDGLIMGTRCGAIDPSVVTFIAEKENLSPGELNDVLNKKSGIFGVSGISNDVRDVMTAAENGSERAKFAIEILEYQITKFIGSYIAAMNGLDAIVFTGGIGENYCKLRHNVCKSLSYFGVSIDSKVNDETFSRKETCISECNSKIKVFVIPTNEEILIARDTRDVILKTNAFSQMK